MCVRNFVQGLDGRSVSDTSQSYYEQTNKYRRHVGLFLHGAGVLPTCRLPDFAGGFRIVAPESEAVAGAVPVAELLNNLGVQNDCVEAPTIDGNVKKTWCSGVWGVSQRNTSCSCIPRVGLIFGDCGCSEYVGPQPSCRHGLQNRSSDRIQGFIWLGFLSG